MKNFFRKLFFLLIVFLMSFGIVYAWTEPTAAPPNNNVPQPINVGPVNQTKEGGLQVNQDLTIGTYLKNTSGKNILQGGAISDWLRLYASGFTYGLLSDKSFLVKGGGLSIDDEAAITGGTLQAGQLKTAGSIGINGLNPDPTYGIKTQGSAYGLYSYGDRSIEARTTNPNVYAIIGHSGFKTGIVSYGEINAGQFIGIAPNSRAITASNIGANSISGQFDNTGANGTGLVGQGLGAGGIGLQGFGVLYGGLFYNPSTTDQTIALRAEATGLGNFVNYAIYGRAAADNGIGLYGLAAGNGATSYGLYAQTFSNTSYAGYFVGGNGIYTSGSLTLMPQGAAPDGVKGRVYYHDGDKKFYGYDGTSWMNLSARTLQDISDGGNTTTGALTIDSDGNEQTRVNGGFVVGKNMGIGGSLNVVGVCTGNASCDQDLAEAIYTEKDVEAGDVVYINENNLAAKATKENSQKIIGAISTNPAVSFPGIELNKNGVKKPLALAGIVPVKATNENGEIKPGDLLTASSLSGYAMKAKESGAVIGKAIENFNLEKGTVRMIVALGWFNNNDAKLIEEKKKEIFASASFERGKSAEILLPENFQGEYFVYLTPTSDTKGLYVSEKTKGRFVVKENSGWLDKLFDKSVVSFDYRVVVE